MKDITESESFMDAVNLLCNSVIETEIPRDQRYKFTMFIQISSSNQIQVMDPDLSHIDRKAN